MILAQPCDDKYVFHTEAYLTLTLVGVGSTRARTYLRAGIVGLPVVASLAVARDGVVGAPSGNAPMNGGVEGGFFLAAGRAVFRVSPARVATLLAGSEKIPADRGQRCLHKQ